MTGAIFGISSRLDSEHLISAPKPSPATSGPIPTSSATPPSVGDRTLRTSSSVEVISLGVEFGGLLVAGTSAMVDSESPATGELIGFGELLVTRRTLGPAKLEAVRSPTGEQLRRCVDANGSGNVTSWVVTSVAGDPVEQSSEKWPPR